MMLYYYYHYHIYYGLQEAKQLLEQGQQQRLDVKETLLETIAVLGQRTHSPSAQLLALAVLVGRLDDLDPGIRSFAAQLLCCVHIRSLAAQLLLGQRAFSRTQLEGNLSEAVSCWQAVRR